MSIKIVRISDGFTDPASQVAGTGCGPSAHLNLTAGIAAVSLSVLLEDGTVQGWIESELAKDLLQISGTTGVQQANQPTSLRKPADWLVMTAYEADASSLYAEFADDEP